MTVPVGAPLLVAHRGRTGVAPEAPDNSLEAFERAVRGPDGADGLECDVRLTADEVAVLVHDADLGAVGGVGTVETTGSGALLGADGGVAMLASLEALVRQLASAPPALVNVELKPSDRAEALVRACLPALAPLAEHPGRPLVVSSFDPRVLLAARRARVSWRLALLYEHPPSEAVLRTLEDDRAVDLHPREDLVDEAHLARWRPARDGTPRAVRPWTVDEAERLAELSRLGVEAVITDRPAHHARLRRRDPARKRSG